MAPKILSGGTQLLTIQVPLFLKKATLSAFPSRSSTVAFLS